MDASPRLQALAWFAVTLGAVALASCGSNNGTEGDNPPSRADPPPPNVIVVTTDDQAAATLRERSMPATLGLLDEGGTVFRRSYVTTPLCCPSRASFLTGQYAHNHRVTANHPGYAMLRRKRSTLPVWLQGAGYRTAVIGKYLNGYLDFAEPTEVPPGWDVWIASHRGPQYWGDRLSIGDGREVQLGPNEYLTKALNDRAVAFARRAARQPRPFFLWLTQPAPHFLSRDADRPGPVVPECAERGPLPPPADWRRVRDVRAPRPPSFDEADVSGKPRFVRRQPRLGPEGAREVDARFRCDLASLLEVDRGIARLRAALEAAGEWDRTVVVVTSDHGFLYGQHRYPSGKFVPYEESIRVPLVIRVPEPYLGATPPRRILEPVANTDLIPTILQLTGAEPCVGERCRLLDGRSLMPLLERDEGGWPDQRGILLEGRGTSPCRYEGVRTGRYAYFVHFGPGRGRRCVRTGERELYDLEADPFQLDNLLARRAERPDRVVRALAERLRKLRRCAGIRGRDPLPPSGSNCE